MGLEPMTYVKVPITDVSQPHKHITLPLSYRGTQSVRYLSFDYILIPV